MLTHAGDSIRGQNCAKFPAQTDVRAPGVLAPVLTLVALHTLVYICKNNTQVLLRYYNNNTQVLHRYDNNNTQVLLHCYTYLLLHYFTFGLSLTQFFALHDNEQVIRR